MEKAIPLQGEGEQSTKLGGPCPYWFQPPELCKFESWVPVLPLLLLGVGVDGAGDDGGGFDGGGFAGGGDGGAGGELGAGGCATLICNDCCLKSSLASETVTPKLKLPAPVGVPDTLPDVASRFTPGGNWPEVTAKL